METVILILVGLSTLMSILTLVNERRRNCIAAIPSSNNYYDEIYKLKDAVRMLVKKVYKDSNLSDEELYHLSD